MRAHLSHEWKTLSYAVETLPLHGVVERNYNNETLAHVADALLLYLPLYDHLKRPRFSGRKRKRTNVFAED